MFESIRKVSMTTLLLAALAASLGFAAEPVDINTATAEQIAANVTGIGPSKAAAIVDYREQHGPFQHVDELINVKGIGMATVDRNRDVLQVGDDN